MILAREYKSNIRQKSVFVGFMGGGGVRMCKREREADRQAENAK